MLSFIAKKFALTRSTIEPETQPSQEYPEEIRSRVAGGGLHARRLLQVLTRGDVDIKTVSGERFDDLLRIHKAFVMNAENESFAHWAKTASDKDVRFAAATEAPSMDQAKMVLATAKTVFGETDLDPENREQVLFARRNTLWKPEKNVEAAIQMVAQAGSGLSTVQEKMHAFTASMAEAYDTQMRDDLRVAISNGDMNDVFVREFIQTALLNEGQKLSDPARGAQKPSDVYEFISPAQLIAAAKSGQYLDPFSLADKAESDLAVLMGAPEEVKDRSVSFEMS